MKRDSMELDSGMFEAGAWDPPMLAQTYRAWGAGYSQLQMPWSVVFLPVDLGILAVVLAWHPWC